MSIISQLEKWKSRDFAMGNVYQCIILQCLLMTWKTPKHFFRIFPMITSFNLWHRSEIKIASFYFMVLETFNKQLFFNLLFFKFLRILYDLFQYLCPAHKETNSTESDLSPLIKAESIFQIKENKLEEIF